MIAILVFFLNSAAQRVVVSFNSIGGDVLLLLLLCYVGWGLLVVVFGESFFIIVMVIVEDSPSPAIFWWMCVYICPLCALCCPHRFRTHKLTYAHIGRRLPAYALHPRHPPSTPKIPIVCPRKSNL
jgi:hypothetical protein